MAKRKSLKKEIDEVKLIKKLAKKYDCPLILTGVVGTIFAQRYYFRPFRVHLDAIIYGFTFSKIKKWLKKEMKGYGREVDIYWDFDLEDIKKKIRLIKKEFYEQKEI